MGKVIMNKAHFITSCFLSTFLACFLMTITPVPANAATVGFNIEITPRTGFFDPNFGTGVSASDVFTGQIFFDTSDLTPDGTRPRTILPGGDSLTIAGVSFDSLLNSTFWSFSITGGKPVCFDMGGGCGDGTSQINYDPDNTYPAISFTDTFIGTAFDQSGLDMGFNYSISAIPLPPAVWLFGSGLIGLIGLARRKKS